MASEATAFRNVLSFAIGGGWGSDQADEKNNSAVSVIRGTDFAKLRSGIYSAIPRRFEPLSKASKRALQDGDIVLEVSGGSPARGQTTGRTLYVDKQTISSLPGIVIPASFCRLIRVDRDRVFPRFAYYWLQEMYQSGRAGDYENQSTGISNFQFERFLDAEAIVLPPLREQHQIAKLLGAMDDRIDLLRQTNATLEAIAQALFKSWFVDFDPVRAKAEGREPEGMDADTAALFPGEFEESELGLIPKGWRASTLGELTELNASKWTTKEHPDWLSYIDLSGVSKNRIDPPTEYRFDDAPSRARHHLRDGDTIIGTVRPGNRAFAFISEPASALTGSTGFAVLSPKSPFLSSFVYLAATRDEAIERLANLADGGAYPAVRPSIVAETPCVVPQPGILKAFSDITQPLLNRIARNESNARTLSEIRDTLLPRLISGKLRLPKAEEAGEETLA